MHDVLGKGNIVGMGIAEEVTAGKETGLLVLCFFYIVRKISTYFASLSQMARGFMIDRGETMAQLTGIAVTLKTADDDSGIEPRLYIGVVGEGGGREFPLNSENQDFLPGEEEKFALGSIWEGGFIDSATKSPLQSQSGKNNDPAFVPLDLDRVRFVYLRKQDQDDAYKLQLLRVVLYGPTDPSMRSFIFDNLDGKNSLWLGNEHGQVIYLQEVNAG